MLNAVAYKRLNIPHRPVGALYLSWSESEDSPLQTLVENHSGLRHGKGAVMLQGAVEVASIAGTVLGDHESSPRAGLWVKGEVEYFRFSM